MDDLRPAIEWESRGCAKLRAEVAAWRDHGNGDQRSVRELTLWG